MRVNTRSGSTLLLRPPARCEHPTSAIEKWLLALWAVSRKSSFALWRRRPIVALEYVAHAGEVRLQVHCTTHLLTDTTRALLPAHFAGLEATTVTDDGLAVGPNSPGGVIADFGFHRSGWQDAEADPDPQGVGGVIGTLGRLSPSETAVIQMLLHPTWIAANGTREPAFWFSGRIAAVAAEESRTAHLVRLVGAALGQFSGENTLRIGRFRRLDERSLDALQRRRSTSRLFSRPRVVRPSQVATVFHPLANAGGLGAGLAIAHVPKTPTTVRPGALLGEGRTGQGSACPLRLPADDLLRHALVVGPSGSGKTTFLTNLAHELVAAGHGVTVLDPHGGLVRGVARALPPEHQTRGSLLRFSDVDHPIALNPLRVKPGQEFLVADELIEIVQRVFGREYWGPLLDLALRHAALGAGEIGGSLIDAARLLEDPWFRHRALERIHNDQTVRFLAGLGEGTGLDRRLLPAVHRLQRLLAEPWLRNILSQTDGRLEFGELLERRAITLVDLSGIGGSSARLLGSLILTLIRQATLGRDAGGTSARHFVIVDEASWFVSRTVAEIFDQARKFGVGIVLAVQRVGQLTPEEVRGAVLANAGNVIAFRIADPDDASLLAKRFSDARVTAADLQRLGRYEAYAQLTLSGERHNPAWLTTRPPLAEFPDAAAVEAALVESARSRYARPRLDVERELRERERLYLDDVEPEVRGLAPGSAEVPTYAA